MEPNSNKKISEISTDISEIRFNLNFDDYKASNLFNEDNKNVFENINRNSLAEKSTGNNFSYNNFNDFDNDNFYMDCDIIEEENTIKNEDNIININHKINFECFKKPIVIEKSKDNTLVSNFNNINNIRNNEENISSNTIKENKFYKKIDLSKGNSSVNKINIVDIKLPDIANVSKMICPDYNMFNEDKLKDEAKKYGIKPTTTKQMINQLKQIWEFIQCRN